MADNGLFNKSQQASVKYREEAAKEKLTMKLSQYKVDDLTDNRERMIYDYLGDINAVVVDENDEYYEVELDGFLFSVNKETLEITSLGKLTGEKPEIAKVEVELINNDMNAIIKVTVNSIKGGNISVRIGNQDAIYESTSGTYNLTVDKNGTYGIVAKEEGITRRATNSVIIKDIKQWIEFKVSPNTIGIEAKITIDYGTLTANKYKIGEKGAWTDYTGEITLTSYDVIDKGLKNEDNTITIYAKGINEIGSEITKSTKIKNLDLDAPTAPVIESSAGYPVITTNGIVVSGTAKITFDESKDLNNYYSIDNGSTWNEYTGDFQWAGHGKIMAKSIKKSTGLETKTDKTFSLPSNALNSNAYDGNTGTYHSVARNSTAIIYVDEGMIGKKVHLHIKSYSGWHWVSFFSSSGGVLAKYDLENSTSSKIINQNYNIPEGTSYIGFHRDGADLAYVYVYEVYPVVE